VGALWTIIALTATMMVLLPVGLPLVAALPPALRFYGVFHWTLAPLLAGLVTLGLLARRAAKPPLPIPLPQELTAVFALSTLLLLLLGACVLKDPLWDQHPGLLILGASSYVAAASLLLHGLLRRTLTNVAPPLGASRRRGRPISARRAILATTLAVATISTSLMTLQSESYRFHNAAKRSRLHLKMLMNVSMGQLEDLSEARVIARLDAFPDPSHAWGALVAADGTILGGGGKGRHLEQLGAFRCRVGAQVLRCVTRSLPPSNHHLVMLAPIHGTAYGPLLGLGSIFLLVAGLLGLALGRETIGDIARVTRRLQRFALDDQPDLHHPLTVGSVDEVGEMIAVVEGLRKRLERDLYSHASSLKKTRDAEDQRSRFLADVSHELRTPLNTICGYSQLLLEGIEGRLNENQRTDLEAIHRSGTHLTALINDVLDLSVMESGAHTLHLEAVDVGHLASELLTQFRGVIRMGDKGKRLRLEGDITRDLPSLCADPVRLRQVLQNLLSNALRHTAEGEVKLTIRDRGGEHVIIEVEDTGEGISAADLPKIFDEYAQVGMAGSRRGGTGLGLAICKRLVELHGGRVQVVSRLDEGTRFKVELPWKGPRETR